MTACVACLARAPPGTPAWDVQCPHQLPDSARADSDGVPGEGGRHPITGTSDSGPGRRPPTSAVARAEMPAGLFTENRRTGELRPDPAAFAGWFRRSERFVVPVERGTFSTGGGFELLHYAEGYYNGMARSFVRGRTEDAFRAVGLSSTDGFREEVVRAIGATSEFHRSRTDFNPPDLLCLANVVLDTTTGTTRPHSPHPVFTWKLPVAYDPLATCLRFEQFLLEVMPDPRKRELLVDLMGYCLWRRNPFQTFFVNVGDGANGKTTWLRVMEELLGGNATAAETLQALSSQRFAPAELEGKLANLCDDLPFDRPLAATGVLKMLTGEGEMTGERKFQAKFKFRFEGKLIANANRTPEVRDDTYAFWRRLIVIPWETTIPPERKDPRLIDALRGELPGILNLALRGLDRVRSRREFDPDGVFEGSKEEWHRRADPVRAALLEAFENNPAGFVMSRDLYGWYGDRCRAEGVEPLGDKAFQEHVTRAFPKSQRERRYVAGKAVRGVAGISRRRDRPDPGGVEAAPPRSTLEESLEKAKTAPDPAGGVNVRDRARSGRSATSASLR